MRQSWGLFDLLLASFASTANLSLQESCNQPRVWLEDVKSSPSGVLPDFAGCVPCIHVTEADADEALMPAAPSH